MNKFLTTALAAAALTSVSFTAVQAQTTELVVAFFPEWPMPFQYAQANKIYDKELGVTVKWVSFDAGTAMSAAMASGDVHIAVSQGVTPFLTAVSAGQDLQAVDVALTYSDNDNCVVRKNLEITKENAKELEGKTVGVPLSTAAHTGFLAQMAHFGVDTTTMKIVDMAPVDSAAAFANGNMDMVCGWGGPLRRMKEFGNVLIEGEEKEKIVGKVYDVISTVGSWAKENSELVAKFLRVTNDMNDKFNNGGDAEMIGAIAKMAGQDEATAKAIMTTGMKFISSKQSLSDEWMGGFLVKNFNAAGAKLAEGGTVKALPSYEGAVNNSYLEAAAGM